MLYPKNLPEPYRKLLLLNALFLVLVGIVVWQVSSNPRERKIELPVPPEVQGVSGTSTPIRLLIPQIEVDAEVEQVGVTRSGNMATPVKYQNVGWYRFGFHPGEVGNSVIAGHLDRGGGGDAVFARLNELEIGDKVYVEDEGGETLEFEVVGMSLYDYDNAPLELIFGRGEKAMLNLITCDGTWLSDEKIYDKRLIIFTEFKGLANLDNL